MFYDKITEITEQMIPGKKNSEFKLGLFIIGCFLLFLVSFLVSFLSYILYHLVLIKLGLFQGKNIAAKIEIIDASLEILKEAASVLPEANELYVKYKNYKNILYSCTSVTGMNLYLDELLQEIEPVIEEAKKAIVQKNHAMGLIFLVILLSVFALEVAATVLEAK